MKLLSLKAENVFSFKSLEFDLANRGLLLISGWNYDTGNANGAGKSSLANKSIFYGLFGRTASGAKADDVINVYSNDSPSYVKIEFVGDDGKNYAIFRQRNPNKLIFTQGNIDLSTRYERETQTRIESILGKDFETFSFSDFFGWGREKSFFELTGKEQKDIIESILPISQLAEWTENASLSSQSITQEIKKKETQIATLSGAVPPLKNQIEHVNSRLENYNLEKQSKINELQKKKVSLIETHQELKKKYDNIQEEIAVLEATVKGLEPLKDEFRQYVNKSLSVYTEYVGLHAKLASLFSKKDEIVYQIVSASSSGKCPTCGAKIYPKDNILALLKLEKEKLEEECSILNKEVDKTLKEHDLLIEDVKKREAKLDEFSELEKILYQKKLELTKYTINDLDLSKINQEIETFEKEINPFISLKENLEKSLSDYRNQLEKAKKEEEILKEDKQIIEFWQVAFSKDLKTMLFDRICPFLEKTTNEYLHKLGNGHIKVNVSTIKNMKSGDTKDEFNITVHADMGGPNYSLLSGGEQQIPSFAIGLALADLAESQTKGSSNLLILDEPFMSLSTENCEKIVNFLNTYMTKKKETILLISNEESLQNLIPNSICVYKKNGISYMEEK